MGVYCDNRYGICVFTGNLVKVGQLCNAAAAPGAPEIDNGDFTGLAGIDGRIHKSVGIQSLQIVAIAQITHFIALGDGGHFTGIVPVVDKCTHKDCKHHYTGNDPGNGFLLVQTIRFSRGVRFVFLYKDFRALPGDGLGRTHINTLAATDTFLITNLLDVHLTMSLAQTALGTFVLFYLNAEYGDLIKQTVKSAQRADEATEQPEYEYTAYQDADHQHEFPSKQGAKHREIAFVDRIA